MDDEHGALAEARQALDTGELTRAEALFNEVLDQSPNSPDALAGLARVCLLSNDTRGAKELLTAALKADPHNRQALGQMGDIALAANDIEAAYDCYGALFEQGALEGERALRASAVFRTAERLYDALSLIAPLREGEDLEGAARLAWASICRALGHYEGAKSELEQAVNVTEEEERKSALEALDDVEETLGLLAEAEFVRLEPEGEEIETTLEQSVFLTAAAWEAAGLTQRGVEFVSPERQARLIDALRRHLGREGQSVEGPQQTPEGHILLRCCSPGGDVECWFEGGGGPVRLFRAR